MTGTARRDLKQAVIARDARVCQGGGFCGWENRPSVNKKRSVEDPFFMM